MFMSALILLVVILSCHVPVSVVCGVVGSNNWAVIVSTSRYWFNYRHNSNALSFYHTVRQFGIPDDQIILMLPDSLPCSSRNSDDVGSVYNSVDRELNLYGADVVVDYRGDDVTVESVLRVLTNRMAASAPRSKRLLSDRFFQYCHLHVRSRRFGVSQVPRRGRTRRRRHRGRDTTDERAAPLSSPAAHHRHVSGRKYVQRDVGIVDAASHRYRVKPERTELVLVYHRRRTRLRAHRPFHVRDARLLPTTSRRQ